MVLVGCSGVLIVLKMIRDGAPLLPGIRAGREAFDQLGLLHIETFDPHEPFWSSQKYKDLYPHDYDGPEFYWPRYKPADEPRDQIEHMRYEYAALLSMCDTYLGKVLDEFDRLDLWKDTMLIVNTDHGFLLGEHDCWAKCWMPFYEEVAHTPLFVWDPRCSRAGERRRSLVQTIDIPATLLEYFGRPLPAGPVMLLGRGERGPGG
jgi:arylsulfatase A-like enzyme